MRSSSCRCCKIGVRDRGRDGDRSAPRGLAHVATDRTSSYGPIPALRLPRSCEPTAHFSPCASPVNLARNAHRDDGATLFGLVRGGRGRLTGSPHRIDNVDIVQEEGRPIMRTYSSNTRAALVVAITVLATTGMAGAEHVKPNKPKVSCYPTYKTTKACINGYRVSCKRRRQNPSVKRPSRSVAPE